MYWLVTSAFEYAGYAQLVDSRFCGNGNMAPFSGGVGPLDEPELAEPDDEDDEEVVPVLLPLPVVLPELAFPPLLPPPVLLDVLFSLASDPLAQATPTLAATTAMLVATERVFRPME
jgi:hypothetical protein